MYRIKTSETSRNGANRVNGYGAKVKYYNVEKRIFWMFWKFVASFDNLSSAVEHIGLLDPNSNYFKSAENIITLEEIKDSLSIDIERLQLELKKLPQTDLSFRFMAVKNELNSKENLLRKIKGQREEGACPDMDSGIKSVFFTKSPMSNKITATKEEEKDVFLDFANFILEHKPIFDITGLLKNSLTITLDSIAGVAPSYVYYTTKFATINIEGINDDIRFSVFTNSEVSRMDEKNEKQIFLNEEGTSHLPIRLFSFKKLKNNAIEIEDIYIGNAGISLVVEKIKTAVLELASKNAHILDNTMPDKCKNNKAFSMLQELLGIEVDRESLITKAFELNNAFYAVKNLKDKKSKKLKKSILLEERAVHLALLILNAKKTPVEIDLKERNKNEI